MKILAVSGKRFSGKDTFASKIPLPSHAFAAESKRLFALENPAIDLDRMLNDRAYKEANRPALTAFTVASIERDPLVFCRAVFERMLAAGVPAMISDLRLRLEVDYLRPRCELTVVRVERSDRAASGWVFTPGVDDHFTETELDDRTLWDRVVMNDGTLAELEAQARDVYAAITT